MKIFKLIDYLKFKIRIFLIYILISDRIFYYVNILNIFKNNLILEIESINRQIISNIGLVYYLNLRKKQNVKEKNIIKRFNFFLPNYNLKIIRDIRLLPRHLRFPLLVENNIDINHINKITSIYYFRTYNVDYELNPFDGWEWHSLLFDLNYHYSIEIQNKSKINLLNYVNELKKQKKDKVYIFGTGPSLDDAFKFDFSDGYTIVCNTIVKNKKLFHKINPDFIVASDAIFHFDNNEYANNFRKDLKKRLFENKKVRFVFGNIFIPFVTNFLFDLKDRLIGIPMDKNIFFNDNLINNFNLPNHGNILNFILLPLASTLSKNIYLLGFDGRSKKDKLFWKHSKNNSYDEYLEDIIKKHPAFFNYQVPKNNPFKYVKENLEDKLELMLQEYEKKGFRIIVLNRSYTRPLQKRYKNLFV